MTNLYTFNPFTGITAGIRLVLDGVDPRTQRPTAPHIAVGSRYVAVDKFWKDVSLDGVGRLHDVSLHTVHLHSGAKSFPVLIPQHPKETKLYCYIDPTVPKGVKPWVNPQDVRARFGIGTMRGVKPVVSDNFTQTFFLEFEEEDSQVDIWYETGHIARLVRRADELVEIRLTAKEIAKERTWQFQKQMEELHDDDGVTMKCRHGIIGGAIRLLRLTHDHGAQDELVDFLVDQLPNLTLSLRNEIHSLLKAKGHLFAGNFLPGWTSNVVQLKSVSAVEGGAAKRAAHIAQKRQKAAVESVRSQDRKGSSNGGSGKQQKQRKK